MTKILVGVDLTRSGYVWLLTRATGLARCLDASIDLVYIGKKLTIEEKAKAETQLGELMETIDAGLRGGTKVIDGELIDTLKRTSNDYDVLVVGPREPQGLRKLFEGSIAVKVITAVNCPVFIPRVEQPKKSFKKILLGVDFSNEVTDSRIESATQWAMALGAKIDIAYCSQSLSRHIEKRVARNMPKDKLQAARTMKKEQVEALVNEKLDDAVRGQAIVHDDAPGSGLVDLSGDYDLVLVGTADIKKSSFHLGSVSDYVVRNAHCDVLTMP